MRVDRKYPGHHLRAGKRAVRSARSKACRWPAADGKQAIKLLPGQDLRAALRLQGAAWRNRRPNRAWRLVGTVAEGMLCHKPCTVSGGGKSEISKPITDAIFTGRCSWRISKRISIGSTELIDRDYSDRFSDTGREMDQRPMLSAERSLGSVIKLLTPDRARIHAGIQRLARQRSAIHQGTGLRGEALLQAGVGRRTGASISASTSSTAFRATN